MKPETQKLLNALRASCKESEIMTNKEGKKYRFDDFKSNYKSTPNWLAILFEKAAKANDKSHSTQFIDDGHSFHFARSVNKYQKHGIITYSKLIKL